MAKPLPVSTIRRTRQVQIIVDIDLPESIGRERMANAIEEFVCQFAGDGQTELAPSKVNAWWTREPIVR